MEFLFTGKTVRKSHYWPHNVHGVNVKVGVFTSPGADVHQNKDDTFKLKD